MGKKIHMGKSLSASATAPNTPPHVVSNKSMHVYPLELSLYFGIIFIEIILNVGKI